MQFEHVGSTAVLRLAAKPIIDIDVLLRSTADLPLVISRLAALGYGHQGDLGITGREAFLAPSRLFPHHLYVCPPDSRELARHILFRDYLRTHSEDAQAYAVLKPNLASRLSADREAYAQAMSVFLRRFSAEPPKTSITWEPRGKTPSDAELVFVSGCW